MCITCVSDLVKFSKDHVQHINRVFNHHKNLHFIKQNKNNQRAFKAFRKNFFASVSNRWGTSSAADEVLRLQIINYATDTSSDRSLCLQFPFSRGLVANMKQMELRKTEVFSTLKGQTIFINESTTPTSFSSAGVPANWTPAPGAIIGTAFCTGSFKLTIDTLTPEIAKASMLTMEGLERAYSDGYIHVWMFKHGLNYHTQKKNAGQTSQTGKTGQIVSIVKQQTKPKMIVL